MVGNYQKKKKKVMLDKKKWTKLPKVKKKRKEKRK
jgi:hypothetical protein